MKNFWDNFLTKEQGLNTIRLFQLAFLGWLFFHSVAMLPYGDQIWGPNGYPLVDFNFTDIRALGTLLSFPQITPFYQWFVGAHLICIVLAMFSVLPRTMYLLLFLLTINLNTRALGTTSGGTTLSELLLLYMIFVNTTGKELKSSQLKTALHNLFFWIMRLQIVFIYASAILSKTQHALWMEGLATYYIFQSGQSSQPWAGPIAVSYPIIPIFGNYLTIAFQFLFPLLVWVKKFKPYIILVGMVLHLMMSFVMGLFFFGILMSLVYILFYEESFSKSILEFPKKLFRGNIIANG
ncbi:MAG: hypothetical protein DRQ88_11675 [Epsilonproteobacteria bacterium]|nr:MAG: hypothetical protein DRQ88_11675 [Campylobacterota bacterium]